MIILQLMEVCCKKLQKLNNVEMNLDNTFFVLKKNLIMLVYVFILSYSIFNYTNICLKHIFTCSKFYLALIY